MADPNEKNLELLNNSIKEWRKHLSRLLKITEDCSNELLTIADNVDDFHRGATIASVTGSGIGIAGGITILAGLAMAPFTLGTSLYVSAVGVGAALAGGVTGAGASVADSVHIKNKCSKVEKVVNEVNTEIQTFEKACKKVELLINDIESAQAKEAVFDAVRIGGIAVLAALEVTRIIQVIKDIVATAATTGAQLAVRVAQIVQVISGVFAALFLALDAVSFVKGVKKLKDGSKSEVAEQVRECAKEFKQVHEEFKKFDKNYIKLSAHSK